MRKTLIILLAGAGILACSCGSKEEQGYVQEETVSTNPATLRCSAEKCSLSFEVSSTADWEAYSNTSWISNVSPSYSPSKTGTVSVSVDENLNYSERSGEIIIKSGSTRHKVELVQEAAVKNDDIATPEGYHLVWHDEFDGSEPITNHWRFENWPKGYVNNELQRYVGGGELDGHKTAYIQDDALHITAMKYNNEVISARMNSLKSWQYGYMEARIWLPVGKGTWPAYWMMPDDQSDGWPVCGEIDIMEEVGCVPNEVSSSVHTGEYNHMKGNQKTSKRTLSGAESSYHIYALEWTADAIKTYVDGKLLFTYTNDGKGNKQTWPFNKKFYITLNLAWGGSWGGMWGVDENALPTTMKVDYVRVFQKD